MWLAILGVLALPASCITWAVVADSLAEREAHAFCDDIPVGADLAPIVTAFDREHPGSSSKVSARHYAVPEWPGHRFMFPGVMLDRAYCDAVADPQGQVVSKNAYILYD